jgi:RNA polymerase sigma-70 factor (ECF subfamily)
VHDGFVPLDEQDPATWDAALISQGETLLSRARVFNRVGRFQLEAAIQSWHSLRSSDLAALQKLHRALIAIAPTLGAHVSLASVLPPREGLAYLDALGTAADRFQPAWATRAHLIAALGGDATAAYEKAASLTTDPDVRRFLQQRAIG